MVVNDLWYLVLASFRFATDVSLLKVMGGTPDIILNIVSCSLQHEIATWKLQWDNNVASACILSKLQWNHFEMTTRKDLFTYIYKSIFLGNVEIISTEKSLISFNK